MAEPFNMSKLSTADKILLGAGLLYVIDSFLPWNRACVGAGGVEFCASANLWRNVGIIAALAAIALVVVVAISAFGTGMAAMPPILVPALAAGVVVFTILKIIIDNEFLSFGAWIGLILSLAIAYGGWMKMQGARTTTAPPPAI